MSDAICRRSLVTGVGAVLIPGLAFAEGNGVRHHGALIRVPSLDAALAFWGDGMGFAIAEFRPREGLARLASNLPIYLEEAPEGRLPPASAALVEITFQSNNLEASQLVLASAGARILTQQPREVAVGRSIVFSDIFGIPHHLLQSNRSPPVFAEPRIYNCGFEVPQSEIGPTRRLLEEGLGFKPMTERYFPPSIPYLEVDDSFAFMLHHNQPGSPDVESRMNGASDDLGVSQVFTTTDLPAISNAAVAAGAVALDRRSRRFGVASRRAFATPGGAPFEIWSWG